MKLDAKNLFFALILVFLMPKSCLSKEKIAIIDSFTKQRINLIIQKQSILSKIPIGKVIGAVSAFFIGTPYKAHMLVGSPNTKEILVANFNAMDCFTLLDYVRALSLSRNYDAFLNNLVKTRYAKGHIAYFSRKHFFSDWFSVAPVNASDITKYLRENYVTVKKHLNLNSSGNEYIKGLGFINRNIDYIPGKYIDQTVLDRLKTGDFVGVYSPLVGLDVSHVGIVIKQQGNVYFRNASSLSHNMKVVDVPFINYMTHKPGIIVLRMKEPTSSKIF